MDKFLAMDWLKIAHDALAVAGAVQLILIGVAGIFMLIPGQEPERTLLSIAGWLARFSRKSPPQDQIEPKDAQKQEAPAPTTGTEGKTVSTWEAIKIIISIIPKVIGLVENLAAQIKKKEFNDWISELDDTTRALEKATTTAERVAAAKRLRDLARRM